MTANRLVRPDVSLTEGAARTAMPRHRANGATAAAGAPPTEGAAPTLARAGAVSIAAPRLAAGRYAPAFTSSCKRMYFSSMSGSSASKKMPARLS